MSASSKGWSGVATRIFWSSKARICSWHVQNGTGSSLLGVASVSLVYCKMLSELCWKWVVWIPPFEMVFFYTEFWLFENEYQKKAMSREANISYHHQQIFSEFWVSRYAQCDRAFKAGGDGIIFPLMLNSPIWSMEACAPCPGIPEIICKHAVWEHSHFYVGYRPKECKFHQ